MKQIFIILLLVVLSASCSNDITMPEQNQQNDYSNHFTFDAITEPSNWMTYNSLEEMLKACQIPEEILHNIPTDELIKICLNHPLAFIYTAYNNEAVGADIIFNNFNGFKELNSRKEHCNNVLKFYSDIKLQDSPIQAYSNKDNFSAPIKMGFLELYLASPANAELLSPKNIGKFNKVISEKYLEKQQHPDCYKMLSLRKSYLLKAKVAIATGELNHDEEKSVLEFINDGGTFNNEAQAKRIISLTSK